jgi:glycosyltransferase involved in cell wall biosynthesis
MVAIGNSLRFTEYATEKDIAVKEKTVIVVARFDEDTKRISLVLKAWRQIEADPQYNEWKLQLVGNGRDLPFYQYLVQRWHLERVEFTGQQNPQAYYRKASLFLMTSTAEGWGLVLTEAHQMGTPTIAMDSFGAVHDIISDDYNGRIVSNGDLEAFYQALVDLMSDDIKRQRMSYNAVESSKRFEIAKVAAKWQALFDELLQDKK